MASMLYSTTYLNYNSHRNLLVPHCQKESLELLHCNTVFELLDLAAAVLYSLFCILTSNKNHVFPTKQLKSCRAEMNLQP